MLKGEQFPPDSWNVTTFLKWACLKIVYPQMSSCIKMFSTKIVRHYIHVHPIFRHTQLPDSDPVSQIPLLQEHGCGPRLQCRPALFLIERFCLARSDRSSKKNSCNMRQLESLYWAFFKCGIPESPWLFQCEIIESWSWFGWFGVPLHDYPWLQQHPWEEGCCLEQISFLLAGTVVLGAYHCKPWQAVICIIYIYTHCCNML